MICQIAIWNINYLGAQRSERVYAEGHLVAPALCTLLSCPTRDLLGD